VKWRKRLADPVQEDAGPGQRNGNEMPVKTKLRATTKSGAKAAHVANKNVEGVAIWNLSVLIVPDEDFWFAQGLEIDYGAQGDTPEDAQVNFQAGLLATVCQHLRVHGNIERLLKFAPSEILIEAAKNKPLIKRFTQVSIHEIADAAVQQALPFDGIDYRVLQAVA
jgi:hypothetical protein